MLKALLNLGLFAGILAATESIIYSKIYSSALGVDFSMIVTIPDITIVSITVCLVAGMAYLFLYKWLQERTKFTFNTMFVLLSLATVVLPLSFKLPLAIDNPELFPGLIIPMHIFPVLAWFTLKPLLFNNSAGLGQVNKATSFSEQTNGL
jgi:uncharacterized membrane protein